MRGIAHLFEGHRRTLRKKRSPPSPFRQGHHGLLRWAERLPNSNFPPRYNVAPTDQIPIVRVDPRDDMRELTMARWGLLQSRGSKGLPIGDDHNLGGSRPIVLAH